MTFSGRFGQQVFTIALSKLFAVVLIIIIYSKNVENCLVGVNKQVIKIDEITSSQLGTMGIK